MAVTRPYPDYPEHRPLSLAERIARFEARAMAFFRAEFGPLAGKLSDADLRRVVRLAYRTARARGFVTEPQLLSYLIAVAFWGSEFESDPQFEAPLLRCGWIDPAGRPLPKPSLTALMHEIDAWVAATDPDRRDQRRCLAVLRQQFRLPDYVPTLPEVMQAMRRAFPARYDRIPQPARERLAQNAYARAQKLGLSGPDAVVHVCLCLGFGQGFGDDPLYPWAKAALYSGPTDVGLRRRALEKGLAAYWAAAVDTPIAEAMRRSGS